MLSLRSNLAASLDAEAQCCRTLSAVNQRTAGALPPAWLRAGHARRTLGPRARGVPAQQHSYAGASIQQRAHAERCRPRLNALSLVVWCAQRAAALAKATREYRRCLRSWALLNHLPAWLRCVVLSASTGCIASTMIALHRLICVPRSRADPRWPAVQRQIGLDVARTPCGGAPIVQEHLKAVLEAFALQNDCQYTQVRRALASRCHSCH